MLSSRKLKQCRLEAQSTVDDLAGAIIRPGLPREKALAALKNWEEGLFRPQVRSADIDALARALTVERFDLVVWSASHRYAPMAPRKIRLIAELIRGRTVQDALDLLKFANKRAAVYVDKVLRSAIANADEQEADIERLYVAEAQVDEGGIRPGTRRWRPKDRGRAVSWTKLSSHIRISVDME